MTTTHGDLAAQEQERKRKKRGAIVKFSLAGVALVGIGAAATSAAWTDDAWFKGTASAVNPDSGVKLEASLDGNNWYDADVVTDQDVVDHLTIDSSTFANLVPGESREITLHIRNSGDVDLAVTPAVHATGDLFGTGKDGLGSKPATASVDLAANTVVAHGDVEDVLLTITAGAWNDTAADKASYGDADGSLTIDFAGTTDLP